MTVSDTHADTLREALRRLWNYDENLTGVAHTARASVDALCDERDRERARADRAEAALRGLMDALLIDEDGSLVTPMNGWAPAWVEAQAALSAGSALSFASKVAACGCSFRPGATATCPHGNTLAALSAGSGGRETP